MCIIRTNKATFSFTWARCKIEQFIIYSSRATGKLPQNMKPTAVPKNYHFIYTFDKLTVPAKIIPISKNLPRIFATSCNEMTAESFIDVRYLPAHPYKLRGNYIIRLRYRVGPNLIRHLRAMFVGMKILGIDQYNFRIEMDKAVELLENQKRYLNSGTVNTNQRIHIQTIILFRNYFPLAVSRPNSVY